MSKAFTVIELDKHRNLRYGYKALIEVEEIFGVGIAKVNWDSLRLKEMANILLCGLKHEDNDLTLEKLIDLLDEFSDINKLADKLAEAIDNALPDEVEGSKKKNVNK